MLFATAPFDSKYNVRIVIEVHSLTPMPRSHAGLAGVRTQYHTTRHNQPARRGVFDKTHSASGSRGSEVCGGHFGMYCVTSRTFDGVAGGGAEGGDCG